MKKTLSLFAAFFVCFCLYAQTRALKNNIAIGAGFQNFNGDMGNTFFKTGEEVYGFVYLGYHRYLNRSFDLGFRATSGDIGRCLEGEEIAEYNSTFMMRARMTAGTVLLKYKFANGYVLHEAAKVAPFLNIGFSVNNMRDIWTHNRVNEGNYTALNGGAGVQFNITKRLNFIYHLGFGIFTSDNIDFRLQGSNDRYMQNTFTLGMNL
jgi:hypothetical protein